MSGFTIHNDDSKMVLFPEFEKDRLLGLYIYLDDKDHPGCDVENEFTFSYDDSVFLRDYLTSVINLYDKKEIENNLEKSKSKSALNIYMRNPQSKC